MWKMIVHAPNICVGMITIVFLLIWLTAWTLNALKNTHFDLNSLRDMYIWLMTQLNATHAINSVFNSPRGNMPRWEEPSASPADRG
jgi:hypothetical protein